MPQNYGKIRNPSLCLNCGFLKITFFVAINCLKLYHSLPVLPKRSFMNRFTEAILSAIGLSSILWNSISMQRKHPRKQSTPQSHWMRSYSMLLLMTTIDQIAYALISIAVSYGCQQLLFCGGIGHSAYLLWAQNYKKIRNPRLSPELRIIFFTTITIKQTFL